MIKLAGIWKTKSEKGDQYYSGTIRPGLKVLVFQNKQKKAGDNQPDFHVFLKQYELGSGGNGSGNEEEPGEL